MAGPSRRDIGDALGEVLVGAARATEREAKGYVVVVLDCDCEPPKVVSAYGPCPTPEDALILAGRFDADPYTGTHPEDGEPGWRHVVVPLFAP